MDYAKLEQLHKTTNLETINFTSNFCQNIRVAQIEILQYKFSIRLTKLPTSWFGIVSGILTIS